MCFCPYILLRYPNTRHCVRFYSTLNKTALLLSLIIIVFLCAVFFFAAAIQNIFLSRFPNSCIMNVTQRCKLNKRYMTGGNSCGWTNGDFISISLNSCSVTQRVPVNAVCFRTGKGTEILVFTNFEWLPYFLPYISCEYTRIGVVNPINCVVLVGSLLPRIEETVSRCKR
jgi:hypothetical protein